MTVLQNFHAKKRVVASFLAVAPLMLFLALAPAALCASEGILIPREVFVGDTAELSFESGAFSSILEPGTLYALPSEDFPVSDDLAIKSILVAQNGAAASVTIRFVPWKAGVLTIPSFELKKVRVMPPVVRIASLVEKTGRTVIEPARPPLLVPGTTWLLYGSVAAFLCLAALGSFAAVRLGKYFLQSPGKRNAKRRAAVFMKEAKALERAAGKTSSSSWYARFSLLLRRYLGAFCEEDFLAFLPLTGSEISFRVRCKTEPMDPSGSGAFADRTAALFSASDAIRFGSRGECDGSGGGSGDVSGGVSSDESGGGSGDASAETAARELSDLSSAKDLVASLEAALAESKKEDDDHARI